MLFKFQEAVIETITKGRSKYQVANVTYTYNGDNRTQKLMSFANPESFKVVQDLKSGDMIEVTVTKNDAGYNQWAAVKKVDSEGSVAPVVASNSPVTGKVLGNQYETRDERNTRQLHIVKQSSISNAINLLSPGAKGALNVEDVLSTAQQLVDFVYDNSLAELIAKPNEGLEDVPY